MDGNDALNRLKGMVVEVPGTEWTVADAAKLSGLEPTVCRAILETLERDGLLTRRADGVFVRGGIGMAARAVDAERCSRRGVEVAPAWSMAVDAERERIVLERRLEVATAERCMMHRLAPAVLFFLLR